MSNCDTTSSLTSQTSGPTSCRLENQCDFAQWRGTSCRPTLPLELGMQGLAYCVLRIARLAAPGFLRIQSAHRWCSICLYPRTIQNIPVHLLTSHNWLVVYLPLWKIWKSMGRIIPYIMENKKCLKPPTSNSSWYHFYGSVWRSPPLLVDDKIIPVK